MKSYLIFLQNSFKNEKNIVLFITFMLFALKAIFTVYNATGPSILNDEYIYKFNAESIFHLQRYADAHYPPAYSIALAPALFFDGWYEAMLVINAFISSMTVPAAWLLAKAAGTRHPLVPAALAAIIPFHAVYPSFLLSENLFVPAFCLALALALRGASASLMEAVLFGLALGLAHMTKYLFLPAVPLLYIGWLWGMRRPENGRPDSWAKALAPAGGYALVAGLWLWYGQSSGFHFRELLGLDISAAGRLVTNAGEAAMKIRQFATTESFFMWACAYAAFFFLTWMPVWGIGMIWAGEKFSGRSPGRLRSTSSLFLLLALALILGFCLTALLHSFGGQYNYPKPNRIMGRYLVHLGPVILIFVTMAFEGIHYKNKTAQMRSVIYIALLSTLAGACAMWVIKGGIWEFPSFFYKDKINLLNLSTLGSAGYIILAMVSVVASALLALKDSTQPAMVAAPLATFILISSIGYTCSAPYRLEGLHLRMVASASATIPFKDRNIFIFVDKAKIPAKNFVGCARFWGLGETRLARLQNREDLLSFSDGTSLGMLISPQTLDLPCLVRYSFKGQNFAIYSVDRTEVFESMLAGNDLSAESKD
mgnify:CR=1 FL=1